MSVASPALDHLTASDYDRVYVPSEDTFLFEDVLKQEFAKGRWDEEGGGLLCLEVGPGSGYLSSVVASLLRSVSVSGNRKASLGGFVVAVDVSQEACKLTGRTGKRNKHGRVMDVVRGDAAKSFLVNSSEGFDLIIFNPPYVPSEKDELGRDDITASYAGGERGREVTDLALTSICPCLRQGGNFYILLIAQNDVQEFRSFVLEKFGLTSEIVGERKSGWEHQYIVRCFRSVG